MDLNEIRREIDLIDRQLLELFLQRMELARQVAAYKLQNGLPIFHSQREEEIIRRAKENAGEEMSEYAADFFTAMMDISKEMQKRLMEEPK